MVLNYNNISPCYSSTVFFKYYFWVKFHIYVYSSISFSSFFFILIMCLCPSRSLGVVSHGPRPHGPACRWASGASGFGLGLPVPSAPPSADPLQSTALFPVQPAAAAAHTGTCHWSLTLISVQAETQTPVIPPQHKQYSAQHDQLNITYNINTCNPQPWSMVDSANWFFRQLISILAQ